MSTFTPNRPELYWVGRAMLFMINEKLSNPASILRLTVAPALGR